MSSTFCASLTLNDEAETAAFARAIAPVLGAGDVIALSGSVGAGKTFFARNLIQARLLEHGIEEEIPSPTFTLVQVYQTGPLEIWHTDLYRLTDASGAFELGLEDAFETALCLVEWPDRLGDTLPEQALVVEFEQGAAETARRVDIWSKDANWQKRLGDVLPSDAFSEKVSNA